MDATSFFLNLKLEIIFRSSLNEIETLLNAKHSNNVYKELIEKRTFFQRKKCKAQKQYYIVSNYRCDDKQDLR